MVQLFSFKIGFECEIESYHIRLCQARAEIVKMPEFEVPSQLSGAEISKM